MSHYVNIIFLGNFNSQTSENYVYDFCNVYSLSNLVKEPICFKNPDNSCCIDSLSTNLFFDNGNRDLRFSQNDYFFYGNIYTTFKRKKIYNHQVILIYILPGKTKNGLKV